MIRTTDMAVDLEANAFLVAFCSIAMDLYPELEWAEVEPRLERSWDRYQGDGIRRWTEVRDLVRGRWEARHK